MFISYKDLEKEQARELDYKIETAVDAISDALAVCKHRAAIAMCWILRTCLKPGHVFLIG